MGAFGFQFSHQNAVQLLDRRLKVALTAVTNPYHCID